MARQEQRERIVLPVKIHGSNTRGEPFSEMACVTDVSRNGARVEGVQCIRTVGETVSVEYEGRWAKFRVSWVGEPGTRMAGCVGLQSLEIDHNFFHVTLPPERPDQFDPSLPPAPGVGSLVDRRVEERRQEERRHHPRYKCAGSVEVRIAGTQLTTWAKVSDICLGGCYVEIMSPFPLETGVELTVNVCDDRVRTHGIVRSHHPGFGMGIAFTETAREQIAKLQHVIDVLSGKVDAPPSKVVPIAAVTPARGPAAALDAIVQWFGTHETLSRTDFLRILERDVKKPTG